MDMTTEMMALGTELAIITSKKSVDSIFDKIRALKKTNNNEQIILNLEEIINDLISDKNSLIQICHVYEEKLVAQKITEKEIVYITKSVFPLLEDFIEKSGDEDGKIRAGIEVIKPFLSEELFNIMQILGFNFKKALGEPLTELIASLIRNNIKNNIDNSIHMLEQQKEIEYLKTIQNEEAYKRLKSMINQDNKD